MLACVLQAAFFRGMRPMMDLLRRFVREDEGQDLVEYALLLALIALAAITTMGLLGTAINNKYDSATNSLNSAS